MPDFPNPFQDVNRPISPGEKEQKYGSMLRTVLHLFGIDLTDNEAVTIVGIALREIPSLKDKLK